MKMSNDSQHYGLRRVRLPNGRWEKVRPRNSWSGHWKFSNWMFFNMQRHADHHPIASRHHPLLQACGSDESPELPGTHADMMNLLVRPKRWFEKMDPLVDQWRKQFYPEIDDWSAYDSPASAAAALFSAAGSEVLAQADTLRRDLQGITRLVGEEGLDVAAAGPKVKSLVAKACGHEEFAALSFAVSETASRAAEQVDSLLWRA